MRNELNRLVESVQDPAQKKVGISHHVSLEQDKKMLAMYMALIFLAF